MAIPRSNKRLPGLALAAAFWHFAGVSLAEDDFACPQASLDAHSGQPVVTFLKLPDWPDAHYYALMVANGQRAPHALAAVPSGHALPAPAGWLYFVAAHRELANLAAYRVGFADGSRGATYVQGPEEGQMLAPAHLAGVPEDAQVCVLRL